MSESASEQIAAVDLGSNSFHMVIARVAADEFAVIDRMRERVQLAAGLDANNRLTPEASERGLECLRSFGQRLSRFETTQVRAVGTNTLRKAKNAGQFLAAAKRALGHPIEVISGREEARIIYLGVAHSVANDAGRRLVIDIGGGSTECIVGEQFEPRKLESLHMGCVSHSLRFFSDGKLTREAFREATTAARVELETVERDFRRLGWVHAVGSSGTILAVESILRQNGWTDEGITRVGLRALREAMISAGRTSRVSLAGLSDDRAPVLAGGLAILHACFKSLKIDKMTVAHGALREGLLYDTIGRNTDEDVRDRTVDRLMARHGVDRAQAGRVEHTALDCLDQVASAWNLHHPDVRATLRRAARLHEVGLVVAYAGHHHHGAYLVANSDLPGFSRESQALLASLIRAHRQRLRATLVDELRNQGGEAAVRIAVLLRLATTLNRSRDPNPLPPIELTAAGPTLELAFEAGLLDARPMTRTDLANERAWLAACGFEFAFS